VSTTVRQGDLRELLETQEVDRSQSEAVYRELEARGSEVVEDEPGQPERNHPAAGSLRALARSAVHEVARLNPDLQ